MTAKFTAWSPTRLADYEQCPLMSKLKHLDKLCPLCFKGTVQGGYDSPAICDTCHGTVVKGEALERGAAIGKGMEDFLNGNAKKLPPEVSNPDVAKIAKGVRRKVKAGDAKIEFMVVLDREWRPVKNWDRSAWLRAKMDAVLFGGPFAHVIDWKTGGIERRGPKAGAPRVDPKYEDQLSLYSVAALSAFSNLEKATAELVFLDTEQPHSPSVVKDNCGADRKHLTDLQARWNARLLPMMHDDEFAPSPSHKCGWCDFSKGKGGPCRF